MFSVESITFDGSLLLQHICLYKHFLEKQFLLETIQSGNQSSKVGLVLFTSLSSQIIRIDVKVYL